MKIANKQIRHSDDDCHNTIKILLSDALDYLEKKQLEQANFLYQQVLQQAPENIQALNGLGLIALDTGMLVLASEFFNFAHVASPNHVTVNRNLGLVYTKLADYRKAIQHYSYILDIDKNNGETHGELARLYMLLDHKNAALEHYRSAFEHNPGDPGNFQGLVQLDARSITAENINTVEKYLLKPNLPLEVRCSFYFSLGAVYDVSEKYDEAFANYSVANISKAAAFDVDRHVEYISEIIRAFSPEFFQQQKKFNLNESTQPVFIVGMPQSGVASVSKLLANHSDVYAAGELDLITTIAEKLNLTMKDNSLTHLSLEDVNGELLSGFSKFYLNHINTMAFDDDYKIPSRIIDKKPLNFIHLGLIALLFPKARVIHCVANPLDICLSNYFKNYSADNRYSYDQKNIALYYQQYERLMAHWNKVLPVEIHTVDYDVMVSSPETICHELFRFVDIEWQPECIESVALAQAVKAADDSQLKHDSYKSPVRHWHNYRKYVHALIQDLSLFNAVSSTSAKAVNAR